MLRGKSIPLQTIICGIFRSSVFFNLKIFEGFLSIPEFLDFGHASIGRCTVDAGLCTLRTGLWTLNSGHWTLDAGIWNLDTGI